MKKVVLLVVVLGLLLCMAQPVLADGPRGLRWLWSKYKRANTSWGRPNGSLWRSPYKTERQPPWWARTR